MAVPSAKWINCSFATRGETGARRLGAWLVLNLFSLGRKSTALVSRRLGVLAAVLLAAAVAHSDPSYATEVDPPAKYSRVVFRSFTGNGAFFLTRNARPAFSIWVADSDDLILRTAAEDFSRYFAARWRVAPPITRALNASAENLVVLASKESHLPAVLRTVQIPKALSAQGYIIQRMAIGRGRYALVCIGGSSIGARYASIEVLRRMTYSPSEASFVGDRLEDEPYFTWRAVYINDSNHQFNNYSPNLICPVTTNRWPMEKWKRYIDQIAFQRYNVLQIWIVPQMFSPDALKGGGEFDYFRDTIRAVAQYAAPRGIAIALLNGINSSVKAGTLLNTLGIYDNEPIYRYLSPNKPAELALMLSLWDYWSKAIPEVKIWSLFPGDPGGCHEEGCGPATYVDLSLKLSRVIKRNNPSSIIDFTAWQFFGWGPSWPIRLRNDSDRIDSGFRYLLSKATEFPHDTIFGVNVNEFTSEPAIRGGGYGGGAAVEYIRALSRNHLVHTWTPSPVTEGEGWINHHYRVPGIIKQRDAEARYPIAGGICYTMTPALNLLNQFTCAEAFWNPTVSTAEIMQRYTEGVFGTSAASLIEIFPSFNVAPIVGYTFEKTPNWRLNYAQILSEMGRNRRALEALRPAKQPRLVLLLSPSEYINELIYFCRLYEDSAKLGLAVDHARNLVHEQPGFRNRPLASLHHTDAREAQKTMNPAQRAELDGVLRKIVAADVPAMKARFVAKHYQIFLDCKNEFSELLPLLVDGFFDAFGADFVIATTK